VNKFFELFAKLGKKHFGCGAYAAQPSHDWAAKEPFTDFTVNANGTLVMLEATRQYCPDAVFIFTSTNKVYGDTPNYLPLVERRIDGKSSNHTLITFMELMRVCR